MKANNTKQSKTKKGTEKRLVPVPSLRLPFFIIAAAAAFFGGYLRDNGGLYAVAAFLMLCVAFSFFYSLLIAVGVRFSFGFEKSRSVKGEQNAVTVTLINKLPFAVYSGKAVLVLPDTQSDYTPRIKAAMFVSCRPFSKDTSAESIDFSYAGKYTARLKKITVNGPLGLFCCFSSKKLTADVTVMPSGSAFLPSHTSNPGEQSGDEVSQTGVGRGDEFIDLRAYLPGDSLKDIHWKLSAKNDELVVIRRTAQNSSVRHILCDCGEYSGSGELREYDGVLEALLAELRQKNEPAVLLWNSGRFNMASADEAEEGVAQLISAGRIPYGSPRLTNVFSSIIPDDCSELTVITASICEELLRLLASFRENGSRHLPITVILCGASGEQSCHSSLDALNIRLILSQKGDAS